MQFIVYSSHNLAYVTAKKESFPSPSTPLTTRPSYAQLQHQRQSKIPEKSAGSKKTFILLALFSVSSLLVQANTFRSVPVIPKNAQVILAVEYFIVLLLSIRDLIGTKRFKVLILDIYIIYGLLWAGFV